MEMIGMQVDMQQKSYFPGCYTAWDFNLDGNGAVWPVDNVDGVLRKRRYYNGTLPPSSDLNMFYNRDSLKQTMLKHEAEFRNQIHELHRLYWRHKELMDEMQKNDCSLKTLQSNHVLSRKSSNNVQILHHSSASVNLGHCHSPSLEAKGSILPLHCYDGNRGQADLDSTCVESSSKTSKFKKSNCKKFGKKMLDLELPAEEYLDCEEEVLSEVKLAPQVTYISTNALMKVHDFSDRGDKELSISGSGCNSAFPESICIPNPISSKKKVIADLNIPFELEEDLILEFSDFQDPVIGCRGTSVQNPSGKSKSNFHVLSEEVNQDSQILRDPEASLETLLLEKHKLQRESVPCNDIAGQGRSYSNPQDRYTENLSNEHINVKQAQDCAIPHGLDETGRKLCEQHVARDVSASNYKPVATSDICGSYQIIPLADTINTESSSVSSWRCDFKQSPIVVLALPCLKGKSSKSFTISPGHAGNELSIGKNLLSCPKLCSANDFQLQGQPPSTGYLQIAETPVNDTKSSERRDLLTPLESAFKQANSVCVHDGELEKVEGSNKPPIENSQCSSRGSPSTKRHNSCTEEDIKDKEKGRIPGMSLEFDCVPEIEKQSAKTELVVESEPCEKIPGHGVIDLNSGLFMDESLLTPSHSIEIDLKLPESSENNECLLPRGESDQNQLETTLQSSVQEDGDLLEALVRNAVEAIVSISSSEIQTCVESNPGKPFKKASNSLYRFARVASSVVDDPGSEFGVKITSVKNYDDSEDYLSDGIDYFEAMTLNLTETRVGESCSKSDGQNEEELSATVLTNQQKRGRTRRGGKQRKDFQIQILPTLSSPSGFEVTEDIHKIGGLMEAAGAWESRSSRNAGRNGYTKGRRRSNAGASNVMESKMNMMKQQSGRSEVCIQRRRLIEWGKITRRRRGPRCPSSNPRLIVGQV